LNRASEISGFKGLRILCVRGDGDDAGLDALLAAGRRDLGWTVEMLHPDLSRFLEKQAFESDRGALEALDALIRACELASGLPAGRILLAGESDLGRGFSQANVAAADNAVARTVLADNAEPFRILRRMFAYARDTIAEARPDLVLFGGRADPCYFVFQMVARQKGIASFALRRSQLWDTRCYWAGDIGGLNLAARAIATEKRAAHAAVSTQAQNRVAQTRLQELRGRDTATHAPHPFRRYSDGDLAGLRYIHLALREDPATAPDSLPAFWANQYYAVELVCSTLPAGYRLLVQEHPRNAGRRPDRYHRDMSRLPNVVLVDPSDDAGKYLTHAALVITDDAPAGWQAFLLGRPVIALADNACAEAGLVHRVRNPEELASTVVDILAPTSKRADDDPRQPGWLLDAEWETTAPIDGDPVEALALLERTRRSPLSGAADAPSGTESRRVSAAS
jgi:hypothetical protein